MDILLEKHSGELLILIMTAILMTTLLVVVPQLLRVNQRATELRHLEHLKAIESGQSLPPADVRARAAGRTAALVPMVTVISAATVTCFLIVYKSENLFSVCVAVWSVAGVIGLAAITGGVALVGRLAQLEAGYPFEEAEEEEPVVH